MNANQRTYQIRKLVESGMLQPIKPGARQYSTGFSHHMLLRGVVHALTQSASAITSRSCSLTTTLWPPSLGMTVDAETSPPPPSPPNYGNTLK